jgi:hypothetical protein
MLNFCARLCFFVAIPGVLNLALEIKIKAAIAWFVFSGNNGVAETGHLINTLLQQGV